MIHHDRPVLARADELTVQFPGSSSPAVDGVTLELRGGECVALVGESGSGKSLTARALLGLLPEQASVRYERLEVAAGGEPFATPPSGARAWNRIRGRYMGLVPQDALGALDPLRRVEHEVGDTLRLHDLARGQARRDRVTAALSAAGMPDPEHRLRQRSDELSGGLRQRALIASAFIADPPTIIADEPTTALDADRREQVLRELRTRVDAGAGLLLITHDLASVLDIADTVHVMQNGRIIETGTPNAVLRAPTHQFTGELLAASPAGKPRGTPLMTATVPRPPTAHPVTELPADDAPPKLNLSNVTVSFGKGTAQRTALDGASLTVAHGETVGLVGESGSGKTTLLRVALGLQPPDAGAVHMSGTEWETASRDVRRALRRHIAHVPQDPLDSFPLGASGQAILSDALRAAGVRPAQRVARSHALADEVDLPHELLRRPAAVLSGGQRQRLAIARALARDPELLLLDEPVSALDVTVQARVLDLLDRLQAHRGTAYLFVSHDLDVIQHMSDRVLQLVDGRIVPVG
ncbi:MAG: ABC transporter ATP-binding protein [Leucobacter sp.]